MTLRSLDLAEAYSTDGSGFDPLHDFYVPVLSQAQQYDRLAGFFSSTSLAAAARGIAGLIKNQGRMRLVCSPRLSRKDVEAIRRASEEEWQDWESWNEILLQCLHSSLDFQRIESRIASDHFSAMSWMLRTGRLEIRLSVPRLPDGTPLSMEDVEQAGIFHMKIGVVEDAAGNSISFSGSINESVSAWTRNAEEFKVFRSWVEPGRVADDMRMFQRYWSNHSHAWETVALPRAIAEDIWAFSDDEEEALLAKLARHKPHRRTLAPMEPNEGRSGLELRWYQREAVDEWLTAGQRGILAMATGSGKTYVATACLREILDARGRLFAVVAVPEKHLISQWTRSLTRVFPHESILEMAGRGRLRQLADKVSEVSIGTRDAAIVVTTHATSAKQWFGEEVRRVSGAALAMVGDEAHSQGAETLRAALTPMYSSRLGLSATPIRKYDEEGSDFLLEYYGGVVYRFDIEQALKTEDPETGQTILAPYSYHPLFVAMTSDELERYIRLTHRLTRRLAAEREPKERAETLARIAAARASVTKKSAAKLDALDRLLAELGRDLSHCFIYCQDQEQLEEVRGVVEGHGLVSHEFTGEQGTQADASRHTERDRILQSFAAARTQVLLAMKCLDQGVDVPEAQIGVMLASSQSEREFVQRRGRLLRRAPGKDRAAIYDFLVAPSGEYDFDPEFQRAERRIYDVETERAETFAEQATNRAECIAEIIRHRRPA